ncbi:MAG: MqnA/MqnD/SBP family protein, partial [Gemmatimonadales bacterium]
MRVGRIRYINCFPVYGAIDRGLVSLGAPVVSGNPSELNQLMASGQLEVSVISAVEYARESSRYLLLPDLGITSDGPVRSVMLFSRMPAEERDGGL